MDWIEKIVQQLSARPIGGYIPDGPPATEPTALAAWALARRGRLEPAERAANWLLRAQSSEGSVGINADHDWPRWPTPLAVLAWSALDRAARGISTESAHREAYKRAIDMAVGWMLRHKGKTLPRDASVLGHDTELVAWPWVEGTHSWIEPTAMHVLALKTIGRADHPRTREAVAMLPDRQLKTGGCNYGNTVVLGQRLRPHVQPTGLALLALADETDNRGRIARSLRYLERALSEQTTTTSLCWALMALTAHGRRPPHADRWLRSAFGRRSRQGAATHHLALLALAAGRAGAGQQPSREVESTISF